MESSQIAIELITFLKTSLFSLSDFLFKIISHFAQFTWLNQNNIYLAILVAISLWLGSIIFHMIWTTTERRGKWFWGITLGIFLLLKYLFKT